MDQQSQEREELEGVVSRLKERLERETAAHMECSERARAAAGRAHLLEQQVYKGTLEPLKLPSPFLLLDTSFCRDFACVNVGFVVFRLSIHHFRFSVDSGIELNMNVKQKLFFYPSRIVFFFWMNGTYYL